MRIATQIIIDVNSVRYSNKSIYIHCIFEAGVSLPCSSTSSALTMLGAFVFGETFLASVSEGSLRTLSAVVSLMGSLVGSLISIEETDDVTSRRQLVPGLQLSTPDGFGVTSNE